MENLGYLFAAYSAVWVVLFLYLYGLHRKQSRIARELQRVKERMEGSGTKGGTEHSWGKKRVAGVGE